MLQFASPGNSPVFVSLVFLGVVTFGRLHTTVTQIKKPGVKTLGIHTIRKLLWVQDKAVDRISLLTHH